MIGQAIAGRYQILAEIGRGGMGVVYQAHEPSLDRDVALKILPSYLAHDQQFVARFAREAQTAAQLDHPNIVAIYDVGRDGNTHYIAMQLLDGQPLSQLLRNTGPLAIKRTIHIATQIASALDYAHEHGLVHRDIKPANIMIGPDDHATLTDFGIARATEGTQITRTGVMIGTPEYMAPEQVLGEPASASTDLYSLAVLTYEMLTGVTPHRGTEAHAVLHSIVYEPPPKPRSINPQITSAVEDVLLRGLAKKPEQRFSGGREFTSALQGALTGKTVAVPRPTVVRPALQRSSNTPLLVGVGLAMLVLVVVGILAMGNGNKTPQIHTPSPVSPVGTITVGSAARAAHNDVPATQTALAATMTVISEVRNTSNTRTAVAQKTEATHSAIAVQTKYTATPSGPTGTIAFQSNRSGRPQIYKVSVPDFSRVEALTSGAAHYGPSLSLDGRSITYTGGGSSEDSTANEVYIMSMDSGSVRRVTHNNVPEKQPALPPDGRQVAYRTKRSGNWEIYVAKPLSGGYSEQDISRHSNKDYHPSWDPTGRSVVFSAERAGVNRDELYIMNADGSNQTRITYNSSEDYAPVWSPDGQWIAFVSNRNGDADIYVIGVDGTGERQLTTSQAADREPAWSPDGRWLAFSSNRYGNWDIFIEEALTGRVVARVTTSRADDTHPTWSR